MGLIRLICNLYFPDLERYVGFVCVCLWVCVHRDWANENGKGAVGMCGLEAGAAHIGSHWE